MCVCFCVHACGGQRLMLGTSTLGSSPQQCLHLRLAGRELQGSSCILPDSGITSMPNFLHRCLGISPKFFILSPKFFILT